MRYIKERISIILFCTLPAIATAQNIHVSGKVIDAKDKGPLTGVSVQFIFTTDSTVKSGAVTDIDGNYQIDLNKKGNYKINYSYVGYQSITKTVDLDADTHLVELPMTASSQTLKSVTVATKEIRAEQKGDTAQFNANAYKTNQDASAEDLVTKMPGVTSDNNGVKVNGETVQQILVDGKPFFGTDPSLALKNLPAEVIDKIQVFDKLSDQAQFSGFDDGNSQKTMNILTRRNKSEGMFGKVYAGYGSDERYIVGGNLNIFNGDRRITLLGLSNNINQQNFGAQDLLGIASSGGGGRGGSGSGRGGGMGNNGGSMGGGGNNFMVSQQNGIAATNSFGTNYSDNWGKKIKVSGSYFYNSTNTDALSGTDRNYFGKTDSTISYKETSGTNSFNANHRINFRFEYTIDSFNSLTIVPSLSFQENNTTSSTSATNNMGDRLLALTQNTNYAGYNGFNFSNNLLYQHKFKKDRRTISLNINNGWNGKTGNGDNISSNNYAGVDSNYSRKFDLNNSGYNVSTNISYTEPVGKKGQLQFNYNPSVTYNNADKSMYQEDTTTNKYTLIDSSLSNKYNTTYTTHRGGISYRIGDKKINFNIGAQLQYATLQSEQQYPSIYSINRNFTNILPNIQFNYRQPNGKNFRINYRTSTSSPTVAQLQDAVDISNPLLLKTGNPSLQQSYDHTITMRYGNTNNKTAKSLFFFFYTNVTENYVATATYIPTKDSVFRNSATDNAITIKKGGQISIPVNLSGYFSQRAFVTYGLPLSAIKCNLNFNGGVSFTRTPGTINNNSNFSNNLAPTGGLVLSSNISEAIDFSLAYNGTYNLISNTLNTASNNNYYNHITSFRINWVVWKKLVLNTSVNENYYASFSGSADQHFILWNAYVGYKFLKSNALEARFTIFDILNQNTSVTRNVTETYVENNTTQVLKQYGMFQLTYNIRKFKGKMPEMPKEENGRPDMPPGFRPRGDWNKGPQGNW